MIFVFVEDGTLDIAADIDEVRRMCEPIDVESSVFTFFDADGRPLAPKFIRPNRVKRIFGLLSVIDQGEYALEPSDPSAHDSIAIALQETCAMEPNTWFTDLNAVRDYLLARGAL